jgi:phosphoribosylaminoimidazole-succinocarboxamide synthase
MNNNINILNNNRSKIFDGVRKSLYKHSDECMLVQFFKDELSIDGKIIEISGKGAYNNSISSFLMTRLDMINIENHFVEKLNMKEQLVQMVDMLPFIVNVDQLAYGRYVESFGVQEGYVFDNAVIDFLTKTFNKAPINEHQMLSFNWISKEELEAIKAMALRISDFLTGIFVSSGIRLVSCSLEFGRVFNGDDFVMMLADEISPDTTKLWDINSNQKLDAEYLKEHKDNLIFPYQEVARRLNIDSLT